MLKALSIRQPYPYHIFNDADPKDVENRSWHTNFRGRVLIHAGKQFYGDAQDKREFESEHGKLNYGGIVGHAEIVDCVKQMDSKWFFGEYGFVLANPHPLPFILCRGQLGFFTPDIQMQVLQMHHDVVLSEGQASKILDLDGVAFRTLYQDTFLAQAKKGNV